MAKENFEKARGGHGSKPHQTSGFSVLEQAESTVLYGSNKFSSVIEINEYINSILDMEELLRRILEKSIEVTEAHQGFMFLPDTESNNPGLTVSGTGEIPGPEVLPLALDVFRTGKSLIARAGENSSVLCVPIRSNQTSSGVCYLEKRISSGIFTREDQHLMEIVMAQAASALVNARLYEKATIDELTGLFVHRHFLYLLQSEVNRSIRYAHPCSLIMIDIDQLVLINDRHGLSAGDRVVKMVAGVVKENSRDTDFAARFGGEEFCLLLTDTNMAMAEVVAEKIRKAVECFRMEHEGESFSVSVSAGIAETPGHTRNPVELIKMADDAVHYSKRKGSNCSSIYNNYT